MPQFFVHGTDYPDALPRRLACRNAHLAGCEKLREQGRLLLAMVLKNAQDEMAGSLMLVQFDSEAALREEWLKEEPYVLNNVWETIHIQPGQIAPAYAHLFERHSP